MCGIPDGHCCILLVSSFLIMASGLCVALEGPLDGSGVDSGFRPEENGFPFANYGNELGAVDLTPEEIQLMFGDRVCSGDDECTLVPAARRWMEEANEAMDGGHCEGMAVLSLLIYYGYMDPKDFGGSIAYELDISDETLQREIAYWWATQVTSPASNYRICGPNEVLRVLAETFKDGINASETWTMGIYKDDGSEGHAITPFAVVDEGEGIYSILVYDNNYPEETRAVEINSNNDTFAYVASLNPLVESDLYTGKNIEITGTTGRLEQQDCSFCQREDDLDGRAEDAAKPVKGAYVQVWHDGHADMQIVDDWRRRLGRLNNGTFINEIPGAKVHRFLTDGGNKSEYLYLLPSKINYSASFVGDGLEKEEMQEVTTIGPGYYTEVDGFAVSKALRGSVRFQSFTSQSNVSCQYDGRTSPSPVFRAGVQTKGGIAYEFQVTENNTAKANGSDDSGTLASLSVDQSEGRLKFKSVDSIDDGHYDLMVAKLSEKGPEIFLHGGISLDDGEAMIAEYSDWDGEGYAMSIGIDGNDDGAVDESLELGDEGGSYEDLIEECDQEVDAGDEVDGDQGTDEETQDADSSADASNNADSGLNAGSAPDEGSSDTGGDYGGDE